MDYGYLNAIRLLATFGDSGELKRIRHERANPDFRFKRMTPDLY
jgi:hypothetical protein